MSDPIQYSPSIGRHQRMVVEKRREDVSGGEAQLEKSFRESTDLYTLSHAEYKPN